VVWCISGAVSAEGDDCDGELCSGRTPFKSEIVDGLPLAGASSEELGLTGDAEWSGILVMLGRWRCVWLEKQSGQCTEDS